MILLKISKKYIFEITFLDLESNLVKLGKAYFDKLMKPVMDISIRLMQGISFLEDKIILTPINKIG
jgi:hypothetical protein